VTRRRLLTEQQQLLTFSRRAFVLGGAQLGIGAVLAGRMAWLSVAENERYRSLSESNRVQSLLIPPRRGWIVDRSGKPIAINRTDFRVDLIPDRLTDPERAIRILTELLRLTPDEVDRIRRDLAHAAGYRPVQVAENLDWERYAAVSVRLPELPGVAPAPGSSRFYPDGAAVGHLVGYVGAASAAQYEKEKDPLLITPGFKVGKEGLERTMESWLRGKPGAKRAEVTARGRLVRQLTTRPETVGRTLRLTINAGLQRYAARRLGNDSGSVVVIDTINGDLLAVSSMPAYDPNSFSDGIGHAEWEMLSTNDHVPLMNKVLQGLYPPGSTFKPNTALAVLDAGIPPDATVFCSGRYRIGNSFMHCHKRGGHGPVNLRTAIAQSCDVYFYAMSRAIGIDAIAAHARKLGLGEAYPLPFASQRYGTVPDRAWKEKKYGKPWLEGETLSCAIGQGYTLANPLQLAVMAARLASGRAIMPRLILDGPPKNAPALALPPEHLALVREGMDWVVNRGGTGGRARLPLEGIEMAGKTGTAQVRRITMAERRRGVLSDYATPFKLRDHSLFVGFAPYGDPRYACAVVLEHSGHISTAAPIARDTLLYLFDPEKALKSLEVLEVEWGGGIEERAAKHAEEWRRARAAPSPADQGGSPPGAA
jgi:penicillin-binding protein 2